MMFKKRPLSIKKQEQINDSLLEFIIEDSQSFHILKSASFQNFLSTLNSNYQRQTWLCCITCCWLDSNFESQETSLLLQHVPFPHTAEVIHDIFKETILEIRK